MARGGISVQIRGEYDSGDIQRAIADLQRMDRQAQGTQPAIGGLNSALKGLAAAAAATFTFGALVDFLRSSAEAAMADEASMRALAVALDNLGLAHDQPQIETFIGQLSRTVGVADDELRPAYQRLVTATGNVAQAQQGLSLALDIAAGTGRSLEQVTLALSRAYGGQTTGLSRLGAGLDAALLKSKDMDAITAALSDKFGGQAAAAADTYSGKLRVLQVAAGEAQETIGYALLNAIDEVSDAIGGTNGISGIMQDTADRIANVTNGVALLVDALDDLKNAATQAGGPLEDLRQILDMLPDGFLNFDLSRLPGPIGTAIQLINALTGAGKAYTAEQKRAQGATSGTVAAAKAAGNAMGSLADSTDEAGAAAGRTAQSYLRLFETLAAAASAQRDLANTSGTVTSALMQGAMSGGVPAYWEKVRVKYGEVEQAARSAGSAGGGAADTFKDRWTAALTESKSAFDTWFSTTNETLRANLDQALQQWESYRREVASAIYGAIDFRDAAPTFDEAGNRVGKTFLEALQEQANQAQEFATKVKTLIASGLSREALSQVLQAGTTAGLSIANELIAGGASAIETTNILVDTTKGAAEDVGTLAAGAFEQAGVSSAEATLNGFRANFGKDGPARERLMRIMDNLAEAAARQVRIDVDVTRRTNEVITRIVQEVSAAIPTPQRRASGGPVKAGMPYLIGERGPELVTFGADGFVTPNDKLAGLGGGSTYNVTVQAGIGDPREIGRSVVEAVRAFERASGPVFAAA